MMSKNLLHSPATYVAIQRQFFIVSSSRILRIDPGHNRSIDDDANLRIIRHQRQRPRAWRTSYSSLAVRVSRRLE
eukprot:scaffold52198_cov51-Attheya_sp.AAC.3